MKKIFSVICLALLAGGMIFTSCTKQYTITVEASPKAGGTVKGGGTYNDQDSIILTAIANEEYLFTGWQDGCTDSIRTICVTSDATYTAYFKKIFSEEGVNVTFNGTHWTAHDVTGLLDSVNFLWNVYAREINGSLPIVDIATSVDSNNSSHAAVDTSTGSLLSNMIRWVEYYDYTFLLDADNNIHGDYWAKNATVTVSAFDGNTLELTANIQATMFNAYEAFIDTMGVNSASTSEMMVDIRKLQLKPEAINSSKKVVGKLVPGKPGQAPFAAIKPRR